MNNREIPVQGMLAHTAVLALNGMFDAGLSEGRLFKGKSLQQRVKTRLEEIAKSNESSDETIALYQKAVKGDHGARLQLAGLRKETVENYILGSCNFGPAFFEIISLKKDERPIFQSTTRNEVGFRYIGQAGSPLRKKITNPTTEELIPLKLLTSDAVNYQLVDIYNGDITGAAKATFDIAYDLAQKIDALAFTLLDSDAYAAFDTTNAARQLRTYVAHSRINTANLPTTNDITLSGNTTSTKFRTQVYRETKRYTDKWAGCFKDGELMPTGVVIVPGADAADIADEFTPSGSSNNPVSDDITKNPKGFNWLDVNWRPLADNTIAPNVCYPQLNKPVGRIYFKPELDVEEVKTVPLENYEERASAKVVGFYIPESYRLRALRVRYRTAS